MYIYSTTKNTIGKVAHCVQHKSLQQQNSKTGSGLRCHDSERMCEVSSKLDEK